MHYDKKQLEILIMDYFRANWPEFPKSKVLSTESPDFTVSLNYRNQLGIELTRLNPGSRILTTDLHNSKIKTEPDARLRNEKLKDAMSNGMYNLMNDDMKMNIDNQVKTVDNNWFRFFLTYDPYPALTKITCPVLALNGEKDLQVPPKSNLPLIEKALIEGKNPQFKTIEIKGVNHLFQTCKTGAVTEYAEIEETISPAVLEILKDWIAKYGLKK